MVTENLDGASGDADAMEVDSGVGVDSVKLNLDLEKLASELR